MLKGPGALLAVPRGIVHTLNTAKCNTGHYHKQLDMCTARALFITTPQSHASMARKLPGQNRKILIEFE